jgi:hypothetical protein
MSFHERTILRRLPVRRDKNLRQLRFRTTEQHSVSILPYGAFSFNHGLPKMCKYLGQKYYHQSAKRNQSTIILIATGSNVPLLPSCSSAELEAVTTVESKVTFTTAGSSCFFVTCFCSAASYCSKMARIFDHLYLKYPIED